MIRFYDNGTTAGQTRPEMSTFELIGALSAQAERERETHLAALIAAHAGF